MPDTITINPYVDQSAVCIDITGQIPQARIELIDRLVAINRDALALSAVLRALPTREPIG